MTRARPRYDTTRNQWRLKVGGKQRYLCAGAANEALAWRRAERWIGPEAREKRPPETVVQAVDQWLQAFGTPWHVDILKPFMAWASNLYLEDVRMDLLERYRIHLGRLKYRPMGRGLRRGYSASTIRRQVRFARAVLNWAKQCRFLEGPVPNMPKLPRVVERDRALPQEAAAKLFVVLPTRVKPLLRFIGETGCRPAEGCGLMWEEVKEGWCELYRGKTYERTGKPRILELSERAKEILEGQRGANPNFVFTGRAGKPYTPVGLRSVLRRAGEKVGVRISGAYQLRHTWAQDAYDQGMALDDIGALLGHEEGSPATRAYARFTRQRARAALAGHSGPGYLRPGAAVEPAGSARSSGVRRRRRTARGRKGPPAECRGASPLSDTDVPSSG